MANVVSRPAGLAIALDAQHAAAPSLERPPSSAAPPAPAAMDDTTRAARVRAAVHTHHAFVYRLLRRMGVPERDAEDAQQQVFWVYARALERVEPGRDAAFLFGVAMRTALGVRRRLGRVEPVDDGVLAAVPADAENADELLDERRAREVLDALLEAMPVELRVVLVLHDLEEWTMRAIAVALGVPPGTVASRLRRARATLEQLAREARAAGRRGRPGPGGAR
jgi:RNA polymerase sigma-70 factor (ECF subfamily)